MPDTPKPGPTRFRAVVAYDGTGYHGFQRLTNGAPSIQGALETALGAFADPPPVVIGAGRTDAGVHATGQVIAFDVAWRHSADALQRALNARLPRDIVVSGVAPASPAFHPRYDARSRVYEYRLYEAPVRHPLLAHTAWWVCGSLDVAAMNQAAACLIGPHDFASFGNPPRGERGTTTREVFRAEWLSAPPVYDVPLWLFRIEANAFLYRMVRTLTGVLVEVGLGAMTVGRFEAILAARQRGKAGALAPPHGLTLVAVHYG